MKFLIDTNVFISLEPQQYSAIEERSSLAAELARRVSQAKSQIYVHPEEQRDIERDPLTERKRLRQLQFQKYLLLPDPPPISKEIIQAFGEVSSDSHDWVDHSLLSAVIADATDYLVTEDREIRKRAQRLGVSERIATIPEAVSILRGLFDSTPTPPPAVIPMMAHLLHEYDPIFESFRMDYPGFDKWLRKVKREHRQTWVINPTGNHYAGVAIVNREDSNEYGLNGKVLKINSFKVAEKHYGYRYGELLLKTIFQYVSDNSYDFAFLTVFPKHESLISLLEDFGFEDRGHKTQLGEKVLIKCCSGRCFNAQLEPLEFNIKFGPHAIKFVDNSAFIVPIQPKYHALLFPEAERQLAMIPGTYPFGNSIRKAYLCHANTRNIKRGASLLFYRSQDIRAITCVGVAEETYVSNSASEIAHLVGKRTVYSYQDIEEMCSKKVLAILFRQAHLLHTPIRFQDLLSNRILSGPPQSIAELKENQIAWLHKQLGI